LLAVGWLNRTFLIRAFERLRRSALAEAVVIAAIVVAVAILTELRPGTDATAAPKAPLAAALPPQLPARDAVVDARELGALGVAVARVPGTATVTLLGPDGTGVDGRDVLVDGRPASACGSGCYRGPAAPGPLTVTVDGRALRFEIPDRAPDATALVRSMTRRYRSARSVVFDERLRSGPSSLLVTRFVAVAPNRLRYDIRGGSSAIVIGATRWDRDSPKAPWLRSEQTPLDATEPYWQNPTNVHLVAPNVVTFLDRRIPAWFRVTVVAGRPSVSRMTAAAHFMVDRYVGFDTGVAVSPPPSR